MGRRQSAINGSDDDTALPSFDPPFETDVPRWIGDDLEHDCGIQIPIDNNEEDLAGVWKVEFGRRDSQEGIPMREVKVTFVDAKF